MPVRPRLIAANWKMNCTLSESQRLILDLKSQIGQVQSPTVLLCPPFTSLSSSSVWLTGSTLLLGAQDVSEHKAGAYTGDISAEMLLTVGVTHVILGHSERRKFHSEDNTLVKAKLQRALEAGLTPIVCIGESLQERQAGETEATLGRQIKEIFGGISPSAIDSVVIAYEPIWAIGTGKSATVEMIEQAHQFIRTQVRNLSEGPSVVVQILYGGSVKADMAAALFSLNEVDGVLVGGASLDAKEFAAIVHAA